MTTKTQTAKHTPAPWIYDETWGLITHGETQVCALHSGIKANARLIAAAPELLEACKTVLKGTEYMTDSDFSLIRSAIAKAEGVQS